MREIMFRAFPQKDTDFKKEMIYFTFNDFEIYWCGGDVSGVAVMGYPIYDLEYLHIMQYTGLKDKNGKEIYEGDIVKRENDPLCKVVWGSNRYEKEVLKNGWHWKWDWDEEVIGNIYENPKLLKMEV